MAGAAEPPWIELWHPMGLQLIGPPAGDAALLRLAHAYDLATRWVERVPPPASLTGDPA